MTVIKLAGTFLIALMLSVASAWAGDNPGKGPGAGLAAGGNNEAPVNVAISGKETVAKAQADKVAEAVPDTETAPAAEAAPAAESAPKAETAPETGAAQEAEEAPLPGDEIIEEVTIADPLEPWNRWMFTFNDKLYFWGLKPVAQGYNAVVPEPARVSVNNFFKNVAMPVRLINALLQGKFKSAGTELARFGINTTIGLVGFFDVAKNRFDLFEQNEDLGQTLGVYGMPPMMYIVWPFLGPSTIRETIGLAGDSFLDASNYIEPFYVPTSLHAYDRINKTSLDLTSYEDMKKSSVEPYTAIRDAYIQYRRGLIKQ